VTVYLPRAAAVSAAAPAEAAAGPQGRRRDEVILVVDDDLDVRELTVAFLKSVGYAVTAVESGRAALEILARGASVDLVLIDYAMPDLDGVETVRLVRAMRPGLPVLMMSGYADTAALESEAGTSGILKKPFTLAELSARVDGALRGPEPAGTGLSPKVVPIRPPARGG
jgi:CheY-like chemotaxis protein